MKRALVSVTNKEGVVEFCQGLEKLGFEIVSTGGTGFSKRDVTPEALQAVCQRMIPGFGEAMRYASSQITDRAWLSRACAGILDNSILIALPGSPKAAVENLEAVIKPLKHGLEILLGIDSECAASEHHHE